MPSQIGGAMIPRSSPRQRLDRQVQGSPFSISPCHTISPQRLPPIATDQRGRPSYHAMPICGTVPIIPLITSTTDVPASTRKLSALRYNESSSRHAPSAQGSHYRRKKLGERRPRR